MKLEIIGDIFFAKFIRVYLNIQSEKKLIEGLRGKKQISIQRTIQCISTQ